MGLFDKIFGKKDNSREVEIKDYFKTLTAYTPVFTTFEGSLYEMELTRAITHSFATACSKLKPEIMGTAYKSLEKTLQFRPNPFMNTVQFLYRVATILEVNNNAFIVPLEDELGTITGYYPILPASCEVMDVGGVAYLRYTFSSGERAAIEFNKVGILTQFQYEDDFFGSDNSVLHPTIQMIHTQNEGIVNGVRNSAMIRFLAKIPGVLDEEDLKKTRDNFSAKNLSADNKSGIIFYDSKISDLKQVENKPFLVNHAQMKQIQENAFNYFGMNENILQNKYSEDEWNAYYEGKIEPFAIQLSLAMSNMTFTPRELAFGNGIIFTANRLQYASNATKLELSTSLFDRAVLSINDVMKMWQLPLVENGEQRYIRKEYSQVERLHEETDLKDIPKLEPIESITKDEQNATEN